MLIALRQILLAVLGGLFVMCAHAQSTRPNQVLGTWRLVSAQIDPEGKNVPAYGKRPVGLLTFTPEMHFVEVLADADLPRFASNVRGEGTDAENRAAMSRTVGLFGTYTVDDSGEFSRDRVEGSTFPNWVGDVRTGRELTVVVKDDWMTQSLQRPDGKKLVLEWQRVSGSNVSADSKRCDQKGSANLVSGIWRVESAQIDPGGKNLPAYGQRPNGILAFTPDMHFIVVLTDGHTPRFASSVLGQGSDAENRAAMSRNIGFFGTYTVDRDGDFTGNQVEGATFPNGVGGVRTRKELTFVVAGNRMMDSFQRPDGTKIAIQWRRVSEARP